MSAAAIAVRASDQPAYNEDVVRLFTIATMFWGVVGFAAGTFIAFQLAYPALNLGLEWTTFGRLRPLHTSAVIFAFGGNALLGTSLWVVQRTCRAPLFGGPLLASFLFWGYQLFIVMAALGYVLGITQGREYAEPEWYVDLWLTLVWVVYLVVFFGTLLRRKEPHIYVANWFYLAFIVTIAMLHIVNNLAVPVSFFGVKSYSLFAGRPGRADPVVVRPQRGRLLPDRRLPRHDVLLRAQAGRAPGLLLPPVDHPLLGPDLPLHLGRPAPPALHGPARLGAGAGHDLLDHAVDAVLGRHDQRPDDPVRRLGQAAHRPGPALPRGLDRLLRHEHLRGPADVDPPGQRAQPLHRLDRRPRAFGCPGLGRLRQLRRRLLPGAAPVEGAAALLAASWSSGTSGSRPWASCSTSPRCGCRASCRA